MRHFSECLIHALVSLVMAGAIVMIGVGAVVAVWYAAKWMTQL